MLHVVTTVTITYMYLMYCSYYGYSSKKDVGVPCTIQSTVTIDVFTTIPFPFPIPGPISHAYQLGTDGVCLPNVGHVAGDSIYGSDRK